MSTQKKASTQAKGPAQKTAGKKDSNAPQNMEAKSPKGKGADAQRKTTSAAGDRKPERETERETDNKRPTMNRKKH